MKTINKLENGRAEFAYKCAEEGKSIDSKESVQIGNDYFKDNQYKSYVKKIPMLIKTNGFGATMAFIFSKQTKYKNNKQPGTNDNPKNAYNLIYKQISDWFKNEKNPFKFEFSELTKDICDINSQEYRAITTETLALFTWLRRFAEGLIQGD